MSPIKWKILLKYYIKLTEFSASLDSDTVANEICEEKETDNKLPVKQDSQSNY